MINSTQLPKNFITRLQQIIPSTQLELVLASFNQEKPTYFRVNTLKTDEKSVLSTLQQLEINYQPITWATNVYSVAATQREALTHSELFQQGLIYIQELSSMLPVLVLAPQPGEEILDLTAAPGSKTTQMACVMQNQGRIAAVEQSKSRFFKLKQNLETQAATCVETYLKDGRIVWRHCENRFDRVLLDAPCSSEARFNVKDPQSYAYWDEQKIKAMSRKQWGLLYSAFRCLKANGILVYSTCTFAPEENEAIIHKLLKKFKDNAKIETFTLPIPNTMQGITQWQNKTLADDSTHCMRILPNHIMNGFFIAKIIKCSDTTRRS